MFILEFDAIYMTNFVEWQYKHVAAASLWFETNKYC